DPRSGTGDSPGRPHARRTAWDDQRAGLVVDRLPKVHASDDLDDDDRGDYPVDDHAEGWPPSRVGNEVGSVLPEVFEAVTDEADDEEPWSGGDCGGGDDDEAECHTGLGGDDLQASVGHGEADVDRG